MSFKVQSDFFYTEEEVGITTSLRHTIFLVKNLQIQEAGKWLIVKEGSKFKRRVLDGKTLCYNNAHIVLVMKDVYNWKEPSGKSQLGIAVP